VKVVKPGGCWWPNCIANGTLAGGGGVGMDPAAATAWLVAIESEDGNARLNMSVGTVAEPTESCRGGRG